jgi:hypothetical protein
LSITLGVSLGFGTFRFSKAMENSWLDIINTCTLTPKLIVSMLCFSSFASFAYHGINPYRWQLAREGHLHSFQSQSS